VEQSAGAKQINQAIQQLEQVIQQNAGGSEELASSAEELASQAELLMETIAFFSLDGNLGKNKVSKADSSVVIEKKGKRKITRIKPLPGVHPNLPGAMKNYQGVNIHLDPEMNRKRGDLFDEEFVKI
jgi:methyl-accepting chemotaxis protein